MSPELLHLYASPLGHASLSLLLSAAAIRERPCRKSFDEAVCEALDEGWQPISFGDGDAPKPSGEVRVVAFLRPEAPGRWELLTLQAAPDHASPWGWRFHPDQGRREHPFTQDFLPAIQTVLAEGWEPISYGFLYHLRGQRLALLAFRRPVEGRRP